MQRNIFRLGVTLAVLVTVLGASPAVARQGATTVQIAPLTLGTGQSGTVEAFITCGAESCGGFSVTLRYDPAVLRVDAVTPGPYLGERVFTGEKTVDAATGTVRLVAAALGSTPGASGVLFTLAITALAEGSSPLTIAALDVADMTGGAVLSRGVGAVITVLAEPVAVQPPAALAAEAAPADSAPAPVLPQIAFVSGRSEGVNIYLVNSDGSGLTRLTTPPGIHDDPAWSPDGTRLVFELSSGEGVNGLTVINADGSGLRPLTEPGVPAWDPAWSPDGGRIAFASDRDGDTELYVMGADGSNITRLTFDVGNDIQPAWSPDGSQIVFVSTRDGEAELYVMDADGENPVRLTYSFGASAYAPAWSPDGSRIAFVSLRGVGDRSLYTIQPDGTAITVLSAAGTAVHPSSVSWSPDGTSIAYVSTQDAGNMDIYLLELASGAITRLTDDPAQDLFPAWRPTALPCRVRAINPNTTVRIGPGLDRAVFGYLPDGFDITVTGQAQSADELWWWRLDKLQITDSAAVDSIWVRQDAVIAQGGCAAMPVVAAPPPVDEAPPAPAPAEQPGEPGALWGLCGSCDTCGYPAEECVLSPEGECLWDPGTCRYNPANVRPSDPDATCYALYALALPDDSYGTVQAVTVPNCGSGQYQPGMRVLVQAIPAPGHSFGSWGGSCTGADGSESSVLVTMTSNCTVEATFN